MDLMYIFLASVIGFIFTIVWRVCFSKALTDGWKQESSNMNIKCPKYMLVSFIGSVWVSYGVFLLIKHVKPINYIQLMTLIVGMWLLILVGLSTKYYVVARINSKIFFAHSFGNLFQLIITALILGF
jgi:hypothetical protein